MHIEVEDFHGEKRWAEYNKFLVGDEATNYQLIISGYNGTTGGIYFLLLFSGNNCQILELF